MRRRGGRGETGKRRKKGSRREGGGERGKEVEISEMKKNFIRVYVLTISTTVKEIKGF